MAEWLTIEETQQYLNVSRRTVYRYIQYGKLPARSLRTGGGFRVKKEHAENMLMEK